MTSQQKIALLLAGTAFTAPAVAQTAAQTAPPTVNAQTAAITAAPAAAGEAATENEIVVVGSRGRARSDVDRPVPVDVVAAGDLRATGQTDLGQQLQFTSPSFNSAKYGVNGATNYADPASLRGLGPDQVLVLINGKRRHQFSALNLNVAPGRGTVVTDLNSIPPSEPDPKVVEQYQYLVIQPSLQRDGVSHGMDWYCSA